MTRPSLRIQPLDPAGYPSTHMLPEQYVTWPLYCVTVLPSGPLA